MRLILAFLFTVFLLTAVSCCKKPKIISEESWGQAQSFLEELSGNVVLSANWGGMFRPYVFKDGVYSPLLSSPHDDQVKNVHLYSPTPISDREVLLAGLSLVSRGKFQIYLYDIGEDRLTNVTHSTRNDGSFCLYKPKRLISFSSKGEEEEDRLQRFGAIESSRGLRLFEAENVPDFYRCIWVDEHTLLGAHLKDKRPTLYKCTFAGVGRVRCEKYDTLATMFRLVDFNRAPDGGVGINGVLERGQFRRPYRFSSDYKKLIPIDVKPDVVGDVLDYGPKFTRVGFHSRYWMSPVSENESIVFAAKEIHGRIFGIVSTTESSRTLAELKDGRWLLYSHPRFRVPDNLVKPLEVWFRSPKGDLYQAFYFGPLNPRRVVIWLHGGPDENVSPRFNPYFHTLNQNGYGVLAYNYLGSTGRGRDFESRFSSKALLDPLEAVIAYLKSNRVEEIVTWSVSTGGSLQRILLENKVAISAMVDQSGGDKDVDRRKMAKKQGIPYMNIRGAYDSPESHPVDFLYQEGHDITMYDNFHRMFERVLKFLRWARPIRNEQPPSVETDIILDAGHEGNPSDPNVADGFQEAELTFEFANHVKRLCLADKNVAFVRLGNPGLISFDRSLKERAGFIRRYSKTPVLSLHFNASPATYKSDDLTSVFLRPDAGLQEKEIANDMIRAMGVLKIQPKEDYPELAGKIVKLAPGVFTRYLALLRIPTPSCKFLFEATYYDDPAEQVRLRVRELTEDGVFLRPRLRELAKAVCPSVRRMLECRP